MKAIDIINRVDLMEPNMYSPEQKLHWLSILDGKIYLEDLMTHEGDIPDTVPEYSTGEEQLLIDPPYGEDIYYYYLQSMIAAENSENSRYNKRTALFNAAYTAWQSWYNRTHKPKHKGEFKF